MSEILTPNHSVDEWFDFILGDPANIQLGLERIAKVYTHLKAYNEANKQHSAKIISVAGTNGKGSTIAMMEAVLLSHQRRVGVFTSPHLFKINERYRINGELVTDQAMVDGLHAIESVRRTRCADVTLTYFEYTTLLAWWLFADAGVDYMLLEVGLGGRLDAVNAFAADVAVVTSIGLDHCDRLGDTLAEIGAEKAGICRKNYPVIIGQDEAGLLAKAEDIGANVVLVSANLAGDVLRLKDDTVSIPALQSGVPRSNAACALLALQEAGEAMSQRDADTVAMATIDGRFQVLELGDKWPTVVFDVAHNTEAAAVLKANLDERFAGRTRRYIFGTLADKPYAAVLSQFVANDANEGSRTLDTWHVVTPNTERALNAGDLLPLLPNNAMKHEHYIYANNAAFDESGSQDVIVVFGCFALVAEALEVWKKGMSFKLGEAPAWPPAV